MPIRLCLFDESTAGESRAAGELLVGSATITLRDLIRERVRQEVEFYNRVLPAVSEGLVAPGETERLVNGERLGPARALEVGSQYEKAIRSFKANGFLVLAGDRQLTDLDETLSLADGEAIRFLRLVPLAGG